MADEKAADVSPTPARSSFERLRLAHIELFAMELTPNLLAKDDDEAEHVIDFDIRVADRVDTSQTGFADIWVSKFHDAEQGTFFFASYFFDIEHPEGVVVSDEDWQLIAHWAIWPRYLALFKSIMADTDYKFPDLPVRPPSVSIVPMDEATTVEGQGSSPEAGS